MIVGIRTINSKAKMSVTAGCGQAYQCDELSNLIAHQHIEPYSCHAAKTSSKSLDNIGACNADVLQYGTMEGHLVPRAWKGQPLLLGGLHSKGGRS